MACLKTTEVPGRAELPKRSGPKPAGIAHRTRPPMNAEAADDYECMLIGLESAWASPGSEVGSGPDSQPLVLYLKSGRDVRASFVPPGRTILLSPIFSDVNGSATYFVPRPRKPPTERIT